MTPLDLAPLSARVAARFMLASPIEMDLYARARILEAAGGLPKWTLSRNLRAFLREGPSQFPDVHPDWFIPNRDLGLAGAVLQGARKILLAGGEAGAATAEEVAQSMAAGMTLEGADRSDIYGDVGKHQGAQILSGKAKPAQSRATLFALAQRRAIDVWRKNKRRRTDEVSQTPDAGGAMGEGSTYDALPDRSQMEVLLHFLTSDSVKGSREFRNWIYDILKDAPRAQQVAMELSFDYLAQNGKWPTPPQIYDDYMRATGQVSEASPSTYTGPISHAPGMRGIGLMRDRAIRFIQDEIEANPNVMDWLDRHLDLANLGFGGGQLRLAKMARRVAEQFLAAQPAR